MKFWMDEIFLDVLFWMVEKKHGNGKRSMATGKAAAHRDGKAGRHVQAEV